MTYPCTPAKPPLPETTDELRARIPGKVRRRAYARFSEARAAHWLLGAPAVVTVVRQVLAGGAHA
jgi:hypothetical protein